MRLSLARFDGLQVSGAGCSSAAINDVNGQARADEGAGVRGAQRAEQVSRNLSTVSGLRRPKGVDGDGRVREANNNALGGTKGTEKDQEDARAGRERVVREGKGVDVDN